MTSRRKTRQEKDAYPFRARNIVIFALVAASAGWLGRRALCRSFCAIGPCCGG